MVTVTLLVPTHIAYLKTGGTYEGPTIPEIANSDINTDLHADNTLVAVSKMTL